MWINVVLVCHKLRRKVTNSKSGNYGNFPNVKLMPTPCKFKNILRCKIRHWKNIKWWTTDNNTDNLTLIILAEQPFKIAIILTHEWINSSWKEFLSFAWPNVTVFAHRGNTIAF